MAMMMQKEHPDVEVRIFLMADAVTCALPNQSTPQGYYNIERMLKAVINKGGQVKTCGIRWTPLSRHQKYYSKVHWVLSVMTDGDWVEVAAAAVGMWSTALFQLSTFPPPERESCLMRADLLNEVDLGRRLVIQRLMAPAMIVEVEVQGDAVSGLFRLGIVLQIDFFILDRAP
jgi:DsrE/DsrF-like family